MKKLFLIFAISVAMTISLPAKRIVVNLSQQRACAYEGGHTVFCGNISTGKPGHRTPVGHFRVLEKDINHISSKYPEPNGGAKMHYMLRVTAGGIAMHLGYVPSYPASHGCIRLQNGFAQRMYRWAHVGTPVSVIGSPPSYVSRSSYSHKYRSNRSNTRSSRRYRSKRRTYNATATDILAEFVGGSASRRSIRKSAKRHKFRRNHSRLHRRSSRRKHRRKVRRRNPLTTIEEIAYR